MAVANPAFGGKATNLLRQALAPHVDCGVHNGVLARIFFMRHEHHVPYLWRRPCERNGVPTQSNDASVDIPLADLLAKAGDPT